MLYRIMCAFNAIDERLERANSMKKILFSLILAALGLLTSCASSTSSSAQQPAPQMNPADSTIADWARLIESPAVVVRGFGIVAGLFGTGSSECPPQLQQELEKYIWQQIPNAGTINPRRFIESLDTAVVEVLGVIPAMASAGQSFDVIVRPLSSSQTTSLSGGHLYTTDLKEMSRFTQFDQYAKTIARAQGPIFTDRNGLNGSSNWTILGGGYSLSETNVSLLLNQPNFVLAGAIRNRINERFGIKTANAVSAGEILLFVPDKYRSNKPHFITMLRHLYLAEQPALRERRITLQIEELQKASDKTIPEAALEAIGKAALDDLAPLLKSDDPAVRFHAARCMSNIGDSRSLPVLRDFVFDPESPYRIDALKPIGRNSRLSDADPILLRAMTQEDMPLRLAAYETALAAKSTHISRTLVANSFFVDRISCGGPKVVYAYRKGRPGIVIFGSPVRCGDNIFLQSDNGEVTLNARPGDKFISVSRTHPNRPRVVGPIAGGFELSQFVRALGESPEQKKGSTTLTGLALPYSQIIAILAKMSENKVYAAQYAQGPTVNVEEFFQNL